MLTEQSRLSKLSFGDVIKKVCELDHKHVAYISSNPAVVERYIVVHGQIILQLFAEYPDKKVAKCSFVSGLMAKMEERHHTKWTVKKKKMLLKGPNLNPRAAMGPSLPKRKAMQATTTRLINRIWGEYYSNYSPEDPKEGMCIEAKEEDEAEEQEDNEEEDTEEVLVTDIEVKSISPGPKARKLRSSEPETRWSGQAVGKTCSGEPLYESAIVHGERIEVGAAVSLEVEDSDKLPVIYLVEYMYETSDKIKMFHGRMLKQGSQTVLGNAANERELFLMNECEDMALEDIKQTAVLEIRSRPWGYQYRKSDANADALDRVKAEERKTKGLPLDYYCKSLYWPERGAFFSLPVETVGLGTGVCHSCRTREAKKDKEIFKINSKRDGFVFDGVDYFVNDYVYISPRCFGEETEWSETYKGGRNVGLRAFVVCQLLEIISPKETKKAEAKSTKIKVKRFYRPEDISTEKAYCLDVHEVNICTLMLLRFSYR